MFSKLANNYNKLILASVIVFIIGLPIVSKINFAQNDDWVYYLNVSQFLRGKFELHPYLGPTFYTQGLIAAAYAKIFSLQQLPILTYAIAIINTLFFSIILAKHFKLEFGIVVFLAGILFFNPIYNYLSIGFMTGQYFLLFFLISIFYFLEYENTKNTKYFVLIFLVTFIALNARQVALTIPLSMAIYYFYSKRVREGAFSFVGFVLYYLYFAYVFPQTPRMVEVPLQLHHLTNFDYLYALVYGILLMLVAFFIPVVVNTVDLTDLFKTKTKSINFALLAMIILAIGLHFYKPANISWGEFPYFENTFERTGYYPRGIHGTKYQFPGIYDLYKYWDIAAKITLSIFASYMIVYKAKKLINFYSVFIVVYIGMLVVTETFYDRYMLILFPITLMYLLTIKEKFELHTKLLLGMFVAFLAFYTYQFALDFIKVNDYIWNKSLEISTIQGIENKKIHGTNAWKLLYRNHDSYTYLFSYDSPEVNRDLKEKHELLETKEIKYQFNFFINPKIYLYKIKN